MKQNETKQNKISQNKQHEMIHPKKLNYIEYCQFKAIKSIGLDQKGQIKMNKYSDFLINVKY